MLLFQIHAIRHSICAARIKWTFRLCSSYTHTILLPKTEFPLRINTKKRVERDLWIANVRHLFPAVVSFKIFNFVVHFIFRKHLLMDCTHGRETKSGKRSLSSMMDPPMQMEILIWGMP